MAKDSIIAEKVRELAHAYGNADAVTADRVLAADDLIDLLSLAWEK